MQKQFSLTGIFTLLAVLGAGMLLTVSLQKASADNNLLLPNWMLWAAELCLYLGALLIWAPNLTLASLAIGMTAMLGLRLLIGTGSAFIFSLMVDSGRPFNLLIDTFLTAVFPRGCSTIFALMAFYPVRVLLPRKSLVSTGPERAQNNSKAQDFVFASSSGRSGSFQYGVVAAGSKTNAASESAGRVPVAVSRPTYLPDNLKDHKLSLPLAAIEMQLPSGCLRPDIAERVGTDVLEIEFPLALIAPQLKEALLELSLSDFLTLLPKGWAAPGFEASDAKVVLPLSVIVPQVPEELFKLPEVTPPTWIKALNEEDKVLFGRV